MAYEIGTATSTFDLYDKLRTFMTTISGWQMRSNIDGYAGYDTVYYSQGSHGLNDIFIRIRAGLTENFLIGLDQYDYGDGDTGYINFFAYAHFPEDGDAYAGSTEVGKYGPRIYFTNYTSSTTNTYYQHILSQQLGGTVQGSENAGSGYYRSGQSRIRHRWKQVNDMIVGTFSYTPTEHCAFDGKRYFYYAHNSDGKIYRYTVERNHGGTSGTSSYGDSVVSGGGGVFTGLVVVEHRDTRQQYLYGATSATNYSGGFFRIRLDDESFTYDSSLSEPNWPSRSGNTTANNGNLIWDGGDHIYFLRGGYGGASPLSTPDWGMYTISTDTWVNSSDPDDASFPVLPDSFGGFITTWLVFIPKTSSKFSHNRIYYYDSTQLVYMDLYDDTGMPMYSSWQTQSIVGNPYSASAPYRHGVTRGGKMLLYTGNSQSIQPADDTSPSECYRVMYYGDLQESGSFNCNAVGHGWLPEGLSSGAASFYVDGYAARVRTSISDTTSYVFVGDADRIIVATKSDGVWSACYVGAFDSIFGYEPYAELEEDVTAGISKTLKLKNIHGSFLVNSKYTIIGTTRPGEQSINPIDGISRRFVKSEDILVTHVDSNSITASVRFDYKAGDKIGIDPQPVGVWMADMYKFQTTNILTNHYDDDCGSDDPSLQTYTIGIDDGAINAGISNDRETGYAAKKVTIISAEGEDGGLKSNEARGTMLGVYAIPIDSSLVAGNKIYIDNGGYYIIEIPGTQTKFAIGPLE